MDFNPNTLVRDHRNETRWKVVNFLRERGLIKIWEVADQDQRMERTLYLMTLDYAGLNPRDRDFSIQSLRNTFYRMVETLCRGNYTFLPEPVDFLTFTNNLDPMDPDLRPDEPGLVFAQSPGIPIRPMRDSKGEINIGNLRKIIVSALKTLKQLHNNQVVMQELPLALVRINPVTNRPYFSGIHTLLHMDGFHGYNPNRVALAPSRVFSAPEVFASQAGLTPATDIYAVGKLALQLILGEGYQKTFTSQQPFPPDVQNIINALNLPAPWPRFLSICLQMDPEQRYQTATEAEIALLPEAKQNAIHQAQEKQQASRAARPLNPHTYRYRENPQLPLALLLIWGERLTPKNQRFDFLGLYRDLMYHYNLRPRLFFQTDRSGAPAENPFFKMLQDQYKLEIITLNGKQDPVGILNHSLDPHLTCIKHLILVGSPDEAGVQCMLQHPNAKNWRIHWIRGQGNWNPLIAIEQMVDMAKYLRSKPGKQS